MMQAIPDLLMSADVQAGGCSKSQWPLRGPSTRQHTSAQEREPSSSLHLPLHQLEPVDGPFRRTIAPFRGERGRDRLPVPAQAHRELAEFGEVAPRGTFYPVRQLVRLPLPDQAKELPDQLLRDRDGRTVLLEARHEAPLLWGQLLGCSEPPPYHRTRGRRAVARDGAGLGAAGPLLLGGSRARRWER